MMMSVLTLTKWGTPFILKAVMGAEKFPILHASWEILLLQKATMGGGNIVEEHAVSDPCLPGGFEGKVDTLSVSGLGVFSDCTATSSKLVSRNCTKGSCGFGGLHIPPPTGLSYLFLIHLLTIHIFFTLCSNFHILYIVLYAKSSFLCRLKCCPWCHYMWSLQIHLPTEYSKTEMSLSFLHQSADEALWIL